MKTALKYFFLLLSITPGLNTKAQKKVIPVSQSALTGVVLPAGSKQDKRMLSEGAAKILLEIESKKANTGVKNTEVLYLPSLTASGFNSDSLVNQLSGLGWEIIPIEGDDKYVWLQKNGLYIIAYFSMEKKETQLYLLKRPQRLSWPPVETIVADSTHLKIISCKNKLIYTFRKARPQNIRPFTRVQGEKAISPEKNKTPQNYITLKKPIIL